MHEYDVFISYSRTDRDFASRLQKRLEKFRPPKGLDLPGRPLRVFRDEGDLTGTDYFRSIDKHLRRSASLLVLCSPAARASQYVNDEIERWSQSSSTDRLIPILVAGVPNNEAKTEEDKAFPEALCKALEMPLATSYLDYDLERDRVDRGSFRNSWYTVLANILQVSRSQVEERDRRRQNRRKNTIIGITSAIILALSSLTIYSLVQRNLAEKRYQEALAGQLVIQSKSALALTPDKVEESVELAAEALRRIPLFDSRLALRDGLKLFPQLQWETHHPSPTGIDVHFAEEGARVVTADGIWQTDTGKQFAALEHERRSKAFVVSMAGRLIARAGGARRIDLYSTETGERLARIPPLKPPWPQSILTFDPAGKLLVSAGERSGLVVWDLTCGCALKRLKHGNPELSGPIRAAAFSPDGRYLAVARRDEIRLWRTEDWQELEQKLDHDTGAVRDLSYDPGGSFIVTVTPGAVHVWHQSGEEKDRFPISTKVNGSRLAVSPDGRYIALTGGKTRVWLWRQSREILDFDTGGAVGFSPDSTKVAVGGRDNTARVINLLNGQEVARMPHDGEVTALRFSPDNRMLVTVSGDAAIRMWRARAVPEIARLKGKWRAFSDKGNRLLSIDSDHTAWLWNLTDGSPIRLPAEEKVRSMLVTTDRRQLASARGDALQIWSLDDGRLIADLAHEPPLDWDQIRHREEVEREKSRREVRPRLAKLKAWGSVEVAAVSHDGRYAVTTRADEIARLWEVSNGRVQARFPYRESITAKFSRNGKHLATLAPGDGIRLWDTATGISVAKITPDNGIIEIESVSNTGHVLTHDRNGAMLWNADGTGKLLNAPDASAVLVSPDARFFLVRQPGKVSLYDFDTGVEKKPEDSDGRTGLMAFSPQSDLFAFSTGKGKIQVRSVDGNEREWNLVPTQNIEYIFIGPKSQWLVATGVVMAGTEYESDIGRPRITGVESQFARIWNLEGDDDAFEITLDFPLQSVVFSTDGEYVALGPHVVDLSKKIRLDRVDGPIVAFTPDSRYLVSQSGSYTNIWPWHPADLLAKACKRLAGHGLDSETWKRYLRDEPYRNSCEK